MPVSRAPRMFTSVNSQIAPTATSAASQFVVLHVAPEHAEVAGEGDGDGGVPDPGGDPVGPGGLEADEVAERAAREVVRPAGARMGAPEVREDERKQHRAEAGEDERDDRRGPRLAGQQRPAA